MNDRNQRGRSTAVAPALNTAARLEEFRSALLGQADRITVALAESIPAEQFIELALTAIGTASDESWKPDVPSPRQKLLECSTDSLVMAVLQAAHAGLRIDGKESTLVPYKKQAAWTPMVKGRINLILRAPNVAKVAARHVLDCDQFSYEYGTDEKITHVPNLDPPEGAKLTHAYAVVTYKDGTKVFDVLSADRIEQIRTQFSKAGDSPAWKKSYNEMAQKCALNRVERLVDTDVETSRRMAAAMSAEFEIHARDLGSEIVDKVTDQVAAARAQIERLKPGLTPLPIVEETPEERKRRRREAFMAIAEEAKRQQLTEDEVAGEARNALVMAGFIEWPQLENGDPNIEVLGPPELEAILAHFRLLGPGFGQGVPDGSEGVLGGPGAPPAPPEPKVAPLTCWKAARGFVHIADPQKATNVCIGCGVVLAGGSAVLPVADPTVFCPKALRAAAEFPDRRLPAELVQAARGIEQ